MRALGAVTAPVRKFIQMYSDLPEEASSPRCDLVAVSDSCTLTTVDRWCFSSWETFGSAVNKTRKQGAGARRVSDHLCYYR